MNTEGDYLLKLAEERGLHFLNGNVRGDEEGEFTYMRGRGVSVIDYVITNSRGLEKVHKFKVVDSIESDHQPLTIELNNRVEISAEMVDEEQEQEKEINSWSEECQNLREKTETAEYDQKMVAESWKELRETVKGCIVKKKIKAGKKGIEDKEGWDKECKQEKRRLKKVYIKWKTGKGDRPEHTERRKLFRRMCKKKEEKQKEEEEKQTRAIKTEAEVWRYLNKGRRIRIEPDKKIEMKT